MLDKINNFNQWTKDKKNLFKLLKGEVPQEFAELSPFITSVTQSLKVRRKHPSVVTQSIKSIFVDANACTLNATGYEIIQKSFNSTIKNDINIKISITKLKEMLNDTKAI